MKPLWPVSYFKAPKRNCTGGLEEMPGIQFLQRPNYRLPAMGYLTCAQVQDNHRPASYWAILQTCGYTFLKHSKLEQLFWWSNPLWAIDESHRGGSRLYHKRLLRGQLYFAEQQQQQVVMATCRALIFQWHRWLQQILGMRCCVKNKDNKSNKVIVAP